MTLDLKTQGILLKITNVFLISLISVLIKKFLPTVSIFQILFITSLLSLAYLLLGCYRQLPKHIIPNSYHTARSLSNMFAMLTWIYALKLIPVSLATSIGSLTPIATVVLAVYFLKDKLTPKKIIALSLGLLGMCIAIKPVFVDSPAGIILALASSLLWAIHDTITKKQTSTSSWVHISFYTYIITIPILAPFAFYYWKSPNFDEILYFVLISSLMLLNKFLLISALAKTSISLIAPISFSRFIFASFLAKILLGEKTDSHLWYGTILVLCATAFIFSTKDTTSYRSV